MKKIICMITVLAIVVIVGSYCNEHIIVHTEHYSKGSMNGFNEVEIIRTVHEGKLVGPRHFIRKDESTIKMTLEQFLLSRNEWDSNSYEWRW